MYICDNSISGRDGKRRREIIVSVIVSLSEERERERESNFIWHRRNIYILYKQMIQSVLNAMLLIKNSHMTYHVTFLDKKAL